MDKSKHQNSNFRNRKLSQNSMFARFRHKALIKNHEQLDVIKNVVGSGRKK